MGVSIRLATGAFSGSGPFSGAPTHKVKYLMNVGCESKPHIAHGTTIAGRDGYAQPPNSTTISLFSTMPSWFDTVLEFNSLPYAEVRAQIANEIERGVLEVLDSSGSPVTADVVRQGSVA